MIEPPPLDWQYYDQFDYAPSPMGYFLIKDTYWTHNGIRHFCSSRLEGKQLAENWYRCNFSFANAVK